ncbi:outer membrane protein N [Klebsiella pneumoniae]|nr:outer membrane protein N [Klebsiella pneumoniae]SWM39445.1 outer membrane protein N [Klebsiella pneumoniae]SWM50462.1 outer membrane protein N [Klebsiella pneumoniae]SXB91164.1 outer membrane protein N [Klebsiella pneumoniae]
MKRKVLALVIPALLAAGAAHAAEIYNKDGNKLDLYGKVGNDSNLLIVFYVQIMPDDFVMQLHRF